MGVPTGNGNYPPGVTDNDPHFEYFEDHDDGYDEEEEADANCCGWFDQGVFVCGAVGSEDCDCCPNYSWLGKTSKQIDEEFDEALNGE